MNDSIRLWDTLMADPTRFTFTAFTCIALISYVKEDVINGDFATCMEELQGSAGKVKDVRELLDRANEVAESYNTHETSILFTDKTSVYLPMLD